MFFSGENTSWQFHGIHVYPLRFSCLVSRQNFHVLMIKRFIYNLGRDQVSVIKIMFDSSIVCI